MKMNVDYCAMSTRNRSEYREKISEWTLFRQEAIDEARKYKEYAQSQTRVFVVVRTTLKEDIEV